MCLLYRLDAPSADIARLFAAHPGADPWAGDYVAPGKFAPVVVQGKPKQGGSGGGDSTRVIVPRLWGVPPPPKVAAEGGKPVYNVRNLDSPFWVGTLRHPELRCLVPVTSFMEWGGFGSAAPGQKPKRMQHWFALPSEPVFAFAGIWRDHDVPSFAFLTTEPNPLVGAVHGKSMPLILHSYDWDRWLTADWRDARALVEPFPSQMMMEVPMPPR